MRLLKITFIFVAVSVVLGFMHQMVYHSCDLINNYTWSIQFGMFINACVNVALFIFIVVVLFGLLRKFVKPEIQGRFEVLYFSLAPFVVYFPMLLCTPEKLMDRAIEKSICAKSSSDGFFTNSKSLSLLEYCFLQKQLHLLPSLPVSSDSIDIFYNTDEFLGDFILEVAFSCNDSARVDTSDNHWRVENFGYLADRKRVYYISQDDWESSSPKIKLEPNY